MVSTPLGAASDPTESDCAATRTDLFVLTRPETIVGRDDTCDVVARDSTVSRRHARFLLKDDGVYVEDLASKHGTFVNGRRLYGVWPVHPGELVAFAKFELWMGRAHHGRTLLFPGAQADGEAPIPWTQVRPRRPTDPRTESWKDVPTDRRISTGGERLADKMRMLEEHIAHLNATLRGGHAIPVTVLDRAGHYALRFARLTKEQIWLDRIIELHLLARLPLCDHVMQQLVSLSRAGVSCTDTLLNRYLEAVSPQGSRRAPKAGGP
jgi:hypothetical protein